MLRRNTWFVVVLVALRCALLVMQLSRLPADVTGHWIANDAVRFHTIATSPGQAWRDFEVEFPPLTLAMLEVGAAEDPHTTAVRLAWAQFALDLALVGALAWGWGARGAVAYLVMSLPLVPLIYFRLDLLSVALAGWAMALVARRAGVAGGVALGAAMLAKFWPAVLVVPLVARSRWRAVVAFAGTAAAGLAAWVAWGGIDAVRQVVTFRGSQGWQIESSVGSAFLAFTDRPIAWEGDANRIGSAAGARPFLLAAMIAGLTLLGWLARRRGTDDVGVVSLGAVGLLLLAAPILSWQYLIWLAPWAAVAWVEGERVPALIATAAVVLTAPLAPLGVALTERAWPATTLLLARNLALFGLVVICALALTVRERWETGTHEPTGN